MAGLNLLKFSTMAVLFLLMVLFYAGAPSQASSTVIDGPGFKVEKHRGWFGRQSTVYQDAAGNSIEKKTGLFGKTSTRTKIFGSETTKNGNNITVNGPNGQPLISKKKTLLHGEETHVDGNGIINSFKNLFNP